MNDEDRTMDGLKKYGGKWHSTVPEPEIKVDKEAIRKAFKESREKHTTKVKHANDNAGR